MFASRDLIFHLLSNALEEFLFISSGFRSYHNTRCVCPWCQLDEAYHWDQRDQRYSWNWTLEHRLRQQECWLLHLQVSPALPTTLRSSLFILFVCRHQIPTQQYVFCHPSLLAHQVPFLLIEQPAKECQNVEFEACLTLFFNKEKLIYLLLTLSI